VSLQYEHFGVRRVELVVSIWPGIDGFMAGELSRLFGVLNDNDTFSSSEHRPGEGARFEGEHWIYDISLSSILLRATGWETRIDLGAQIKSLLAKTRKFFSPSSVIFYTTEIRVAGVVPEEKTDRDIGEIVQKKLLSRVKIDDRKTLEGLAGAGLRLHGDTKDYHWHASIEPPHPSYDELYLSGELLFPRGPEPPSPGPDIDRICEQVDMAYDFVNDGVRSFAGKVFK
jgi:hypothetical protein